MCGRALTVSLDTESQYRQSVENSLKEWRIGQEISASVVESDPLDLQINRQPEPQIDDREHGTTVNIPPPVLETGRPQPVRQSGILPASWTNAGLEALLSSVGKAAAFKEHRIIVETLVSEGTALRVSKLTETEISTAIQTRTHADTADVIIIMSSKTKEDLTLSGKLIPEWQTKPRNVESRWFAGRLIYDAYWSPEVEEKYCFVVTRESVAIRRTKPKVIFEGFEKRGRETGFDKVLLYEEMLCWGIKSKGVLTLKVDA
jgi:hypothetical protein